MDSSQQKLQRRRLSDQIIERIISMIAAGELKAGDKLPPEPRLMEQFGVGRSSIREAIGGLELLGLLCVRPGHGTVITDATEALETSGVGLSLLTMGHEKIRELVEARSELEQVIVRLAAQRADSDDIAAMRRELENLAAAQRSPERLIAADLGFHMAVARACRNSVLLRLFSELQQPMRRWMEAKATHGWGYEHVLEEHAAILEALEAGDADAAQAAIRRHIDDAGRKLAAALSGAASPDAGT